MSGQAWVNGCILGECAVCGQVLILSKDDCWHPYNVDVECPPTSRVSGMVVPKWGRFGRPGREFFIEWDQERADAYTEWVKSGSI